MTDVVERVRALCPHDVSGYCKCTAQEAADRIAELEQQIYSERKSHEGWQQSLIDEAELGRELAAAQAREKVRIEALTEIRRICVETRIDWLASEALRLPADDTALHNLIVHERYDAVRNYQTMYEKLMLPDLLKAERERIASMILDIDTGAMDAYQVSEAIRALGD